MYILSQTLVCSEPIYISHPFPAVKCLFIKSYRISDDPLQYLVEHLAGQAVKRSGRRWGAGTDEAEAGASTGVLKDVPPGVDVVGECVAGDIVVVCLCVVDGSDCLSGGRAGHRPAGLGDPNGLALAGGNGYVVIVPEGGVGVFYAVGFGGLVIGVGVDTNEVDSGNQGVLAGVGPDVVGVDVADGLVADDRADLVDIVDDRVRTHTDTSIVGNTNGSNTIDILRAHTDACNQVGESAAILRDSGLEGSNLVGKLSVTGRSPQTEQQRSAGADGGGDGGDGAVGGSVLDHGVQTGRGVAGAGEVFGRVELAFEGGLVAARRAVVEAFVCGERGGKGRRKGEDLRGTHGCVVWCAVWCL